MTLATKLTLALLSGILLVHSLAGVLRVERETSLFINDTAHDEQVLGRALSHAADRAWRMTSEEEAMAMLRHASEREHSMNIRWVWLDDTLQFVPPPELVEELRTWDGTGKRSITLTSTTSGNEAIVTYTLLRTPTGRLGAIEISDLLVAEKAYVRESVLVAVLTSAVLAGLCALLAWALLSRLVRRPIQALVAHAERVGQGDFTLAILPSTGDEIATLGDEMNRMCERLREARERTQRETREREAVLAQLRHADRLKTVGTLASGVAHELGTPINVVEGHAQLARESEGVSVEVRGHLDVITRQCKRMATIIRQLLDFSRRGGSKAQSCNLPAVVRETVSLLQPLAKKAHVDLVVKGNGLLDTEIKAGIGPGELQQVLLNVVINSMHASPSGGSVEVLLRRGPSEGDTPGTVLGILEVSDSGTGMDAETMDRVFEPFFTTKKEGDGTGLGLSVAYGIVRDVDGHIDVKSEPGRGSTFTITLPLVGVS